jgi:hypothetical protein
MSSYLRDRGTDAVYAVGLSSLLIEVFNDFLYRNIGLIVSNIHNRFLSINLPLKT